MTVFCFTKIEFSFNKKTGNRGLSDGYREASIILNGKYEKGVAGGVCQVSTTLYNAALYSGVAINPSLHNVIHWRLHTVKITLYRHLMLISEETLPLFREILT